MSSFITTMLTLIFPWSLVCVAGQVRTHTFSQGALRVVVVPVGKKGFEDQESRVEIRRNSRLLRWRSFSSSDGEHGRGVAHAAWTSDGQFFVFNTYSSGGHQPWNLATYFYSLRENRFYSLDNFVGPITSDFILEGRNTISTTRFNFVANEDKERVRIRLSHLAVARHGRLHSGFRSVPPCGARDALVRIAL